MQTFWDPNKVGTSWSMAYTQNDIFCAENAEHLF